MNTKVFSSKHKTDKKYLSEIMTLGEAGGTVMPLLLQISYKMAALKKYSWKGCQKFI